tara:strand:- start:2528 stop:2938 length:411 start_codon:yes stop_codon:yes gene_type:complete
MSISTTKFNDVVSYKITNSSNLTASGSKNVTDGPGILYSVKIVNGNDAAVFVKISNALTFTAGNTAPDWIFRCAASSTQTFQIPNGCSFDALSLWATENASVSDNTNPSVSGNETVAVTLLTQSSSATSSGSANGY